jgi:hypothetical protein
MVSALDQSGETTGEYQKSVKIHIYYMGYPMILKG